MLSIIAGSCRMKIKKLYKKIILMKFMCFSNKTRCHRNISRSSFFIHEFIKNIDVAIVKAVESELLRPKKLFYSSLRFSLSPVKIQLNPAHSEFSLWNFIAWKLWFFMACYMLFMMFFYYSSPDFDFLPFASHFAVCFFYYSAKLRVNLIQFIMSQTQTIGSSS